MEKITNQRILVLGLQKTGKSVLKFLQQQKEDIILSGYAETISDSDREQLALKFPYAFFYSGSLDEVLSINQFDCLVLSPGFSVYRPEIQNFIYSGGKITGDIQLWLDYVKKPTQKLIAITGSNGKSTVTELVGFFCRQSGLNTVVAGNIGLPVLDAVELQPDAAVWVLELSSFQLETISNLSADSATCLNVSEDHLDRYQDLSDYARHKQKIFEGAKLQVLNLDDPFCCNMQNPSCDTVWFSAKRETDYWISMKHPASPAFFMRNNYLVDIEKLPLHGLHNATNALVALALCQAIGLDIVTMLTMLPFFRGLPHRVEKIGEIDSISFIDDSKGTNVGATVAALEGSTVPVFLIAGGLGKGQDFSPLKRVVEQKVKGLFLIGQDADKIARVFENSTIKPVLCHSLEQATRKAFEAATPNSWILLSPACASMDMFKDYAHRSEVFIQAFKEIKSESE